MDTEGQPWAENLPFKEYGLVAIQKRSPSQSSIMNTALTQVVVANLNRNEMAQPPAIAAP